MKLLEAALFVGACACAALLAAVMMGCAGPQLAARAAEADYLAEQLACVETATTRNEATACRNRVKARWAAFDGGSDD